MSNSQQTALYYLLMIFLNNSLEISVLSSLTKYKIHHDGKKRVLCCQFSEFLSTSNEGIKNVLSFFTNKTCSLDPILRYIIDNMSSVLTIITEIVRQSISSGMFLTALKKITDLPKIEESAGSYV